jgi:hypothetical protein
VLSIVPLEISRLQYCFVVAGYVRKRVKLRISKWLRAVALAAGISRRVFRDTRVISIAIIAIYTSLTEKIGTPPYHFDQWLSDNGEMKVSNMVQVDFEIGPYKDSIEFDVVPMMVCHLLLGRPWQFDRNVLHNGRTKTYHLEFKGRKINLQPMSPQHIVNESRQKTEVNLEHENERVGR